MVDIDKKPDEPVQPEQVGAFDMDNPPAPQPHNWIDRGMKYSCENAGHPMHQAWKQSKVNT